MVKKKKKIYKYYQILIYIGTIILILLILGYGIIKNNNKGFNSYKEIKNKDLVYEKYKEDNTKYKVEVPYINLKSDIARQVNEDIYNKLNEVYIKDKTAIKYNYSVSGDVLSLIIQINEYKGENKTSFISYIINIKNNKLYSNDDILNLYGINEKDVENIIINKFIYYYNEESKIGYIDSNVCKMDCFLDLRDVTSYMNNISYYINKGSLFVYKPFRINSIIEDGEFYKDVDFKIFISNEPIGD